MITDAFEGIPGIKLHKTAFMMAKIAEKELAARTDITFPQLMMMVMIGHKSNGKQTEMARMGHLTEAAVSRMVEGMTEKGLITRKDNPENRRENIIEMTEKGKREMASGLEIVKGCMNNIFGILSDREQKTLDSLLDKILKFVYTETGNKNYA
jgi:DNA-binding MarR family transcriptional regulator